MRTIRRPNGIVPSLPDHRDHFAHDRLNPVRASHVGAKSLPPKADNSKFCPPVKDQLDLGACGANAVAALVESIELRQYGVCVPVSRLFVYKVTRTLMQTKRDSGIDGRRIIKALALFGTPDEKYWPYTDTSPDWDREPTPFIYAMATNYKALKYCRFDAAGLQPAKVLANAKAALATNSNLVIGFSCYSNIQDDGNIPFPGPNDTPEGGHMVLACGYDDQRKVGNNLGALLIQNSWGVGWGAMGFGWLPYRYVLEGQAFDLWTIYSESFIDPRPFE